MGKKIVIFPGGLSFVEFDCLEAPCMNPPLVNMRVKIMCDGLNADISTTYFYSDFSWLKKGFQMIANNRIDEFPWEDMDHKICLKVKSGGDNMIVNFEIRNNTYSAKMEFAFFYRLNEAAMIIERIQELLDEYPEFAATM